MMALFDRSRPWAYAGVLACVLGWPRTAAADARIADALAVEPGATCLQADTLAEHVQVWLESNALAEGVSVHVVGSPDNPRVVSFVATRGGRVLAARRFDPGPASCEHLHAAVGLAIAMALSAAPAGEIADLSPPRSPAPRRWALAASATGAAGVLRNLAFGAEARVVWWFAPPIDLRLGVLGLASLPGTVAPFGAHYDAQLLAGQIDACAGGPVEPSFRLEACAGFAGGAVVARGHSFTVPETSTGAWTAVANEINGMVRLGDRWSLDLSAGLLVPLRRASFVVKDPSGDVIVTRDLAGVGVLFGVGVISRL
jgi:hypothetical protein